MRIKILVSLVVITFWLLSILAVRGQVKVQPGANVPDLRGKVAQLEQALVKAQAENRYLQDKVDETNALRYKADDCAVMLQGGER